MKKWGISLRAGSLLPVLFSAALTFGAADAWAGPDTDLDGWPDADDNCPTVPNPGQENSDGDEVGNACDNCPSIANQDQKNTDGDSLGDVCDPDIDNDGLPNAQDNCKSVVNPDQINTDLGQPGGDSAGDACDEDDDADNIKDLTDNCDFTPNYDQANHDNDDAGDACDEDDDNDEVADNGDNCSLVPNAEQDDHDNDGIGDACDGDDDNDGLSDDAEIDLGLDPLDHDTDGDGLSDGEEPCESADNCAALDPNSDMDGDGLLDKDEVGDGDPTTPPVDTDGDGTPDILDLDSDDDGTADGQDKCFNGKCDLGGECAVSGECSSGFCANGVCCNAPCNGLCETCGPTGMCGFQPAGFDPGVAPTCAGDVLVNVTCDQNGEMQAAGSENCAPGICVEGGSGAACSQECQAESDCSAALGFCGEDGFCKSKKPDNTPCSADKECLTNLCLLGLCGKPGEPQCAADGFTLVHADGSSTTDCTPYACQDAACVDSCDSVADCNPDYVCDLDKHCVPPPTVVEDVGCAVPSDPSPGRSLPALLALPLMLLLRRRRARRD